ncbi:MAG: hypothetical protein JEY97_05325 [Bacteroidales bacterium]|nr:hypothetical protein [Bacteroidales bacterium]
MTITPKIKKLFIPLSFIIVIGLIFSSCRKDDEINTSPSVTLGFSTDTVIFDTVFSTIGSITKQLKIYNHDNQKIKISSIALASGNSSQYMLNIDGIAATSVADIEIDGDDSLYIFVRVTVNPGDVNSPFVVQDSIVFQTNGNIQDVDLVAWGQDAYYINADTYVKGLPPYKIVAHEFSDTTWDAQKPYLIYGYAVVDSNAVLNINAGAKIHFHDGSGLWVYKGGSIKVNGTENYPVIFQGDRLEEDYSQLPGQWDRIWLNESSKDNVFNYAIIKNGFIGIQAETMQQYMGNQLILNNTIIENMSGMGLFTRYYKITATNDVIANCGIYDIALTLGGDYNFKQCTFANFWRYSIRQTPSLIINNYYLDSADVPHTFDMFTYFGNCILYGSNEEEIVIDSKEAEDFNYLFENTLLKTTLDIEDTDHYMSCLKNLDPLFKDYQSNNYELDTLSPAIDAGNINIAESVPFDIKGESRQQSPDLGAYEFVPEDGEIK